MCLMLDLYIRLIISFKGNVYHCSFVFHFLDVNSIVLKSKVMCSSVGAMFLQYLSKLYL